MDESERSERGRRKKKDDYLATMMRSVKRKTSLFFIFESLNLLTTIF